MQSECTKEIFKCFQAVISKRKQVLFTSHAPSLSTVFSPHHILNNVKGTSGSQPHTVFRTSKARRSKQLLCCLFHWQLIRFLKRSNIATRQRSRTLLHFFTLKIHLRIMHLRIVEINEQILLKEQRLLLWVRQNGNKQRIMENDI